MNKWVWIFIIFGALAQISLLSMDCPELKGRWPYGPGWALVAEGNRLYSVHGSAFIIFDISQPDSPAPLSELQLEQLPYGAKKFGHLVILFCESTTLAIDVSDELHPQCAGDFGFGILDIAIQGNIMYTVNGMTLLSYDISNLDQIKFLGSLNADSWSIRLQGNIAYLAMDQYSYGGLTVVDISDPTNPVRIGGYSSNNLYYTVVPAGGVLYASTRSGVEIFDISTPQQPVFIGACPVAHLQKPFPLTVQGNFAYLADAAWNGFHILNISDPSHVTEVGSLELQSYVNNTISAAQGRIYVSGADAGTFIINASDPAKPKISGIWNKGRTYSVAGITGTWAYAGSWGMDLIDVSDPAQPHPVKSFSNAALPAPRKLIINGNTAYGMRWQGLDIWDISDPINPSVIGHMDFNEEPTAYCEGIALMPGRSILVLTQNVWSANYSYIDHGNLRIIDVSNPRVPKELHSSHDLDYGNDVAATGDLVVVADISSGLKIFNLSDPSQPVLVATVYDERDDFYHVAAKGSTILTVRNDFLCSYDLSNPANPVYLDTVAAGGGSMKPLVIADSFLFALFGYNLWVFDISDPKRMLWINAFETVEPSDIAVAGTHLILADGGAGLLSYDLSSCLAAPQADFSCAASTIHVGDDVEFQTMLSGGMPTVAHWTWGDGLESRLVGAVIAAPIHHTFRASGEYRVTLALSNSYGASSASKTFTIQVKDTPPPLGQGTLPYRYLIPAAARAAGAAGTNWVTDVNMMAKSNRCSRDFAVYMYFLESGKENLAPPSAEAILNGTSAQPTALSIANAVLSVFNRESASGAILFASDCDFIVNSRTYNDQGTKGTYGQFVPSSVVSGKPVAESYIPGLVRSSAFRTNVGFVNLSATPLTIPMDLMGSNGAVLAHHVATLPPYGHLQENNLLASLVGENVPDAYLHLQPSTPSGEYAAYASVVDNISGDPIFIPTQFPILSRSQGTLMIGAVANALGGNNTNWKTEMAMINPFSTSISVQLSFLESGKDNSSVTGMPITLRGGSSWRMQDVVQELFGRTNTFGALRIDGDALPIAISRTYNDQGNAGTYGQFIPARPWTSGTGILFPIRSDDVYRANVGLVNWMDNAQTALIVFHSAETNGSECNHNFSVPPFGHLQINDIASAMGCENINFGWIEIQNSGVMPYVSIVDNRTGDPICVMGQ
jgi:PKD repeat protein